LRRNSYSAVPLKLCKHYAHTTHRLQQVLCTDAAFLGIRLLRKTFSGIRLGSDGSLENSAIGSQQPPTLSKPCNPTVFVTAFKILNYESILTHKKNFVNSFLKFFELLHIHITFLHTTALLFPLKYDILQLCFLRT